MDNSRYEPRQSTPVFRSGPEGSDSTLLPMLIVGLVLAIVGTLFIMMFV